MDGQYGGRGVIRKTGKLGRWLRGRGTASSRFGTFFGAWRALRLSEMLIGLAAWPSSLLLLLVSSVSFAVPSKRNDCAAWSGCCEWVMRRAGCRESGTESIAECGRLAISQKSTVNQQRATEGASRLGVPRQQQWKQAHCGLDKKDWAPRISSMQQPGTSVASACPARNESRAR